MDEASPMDIGIRLNAAFWNAKASADSFVDNSAGKLKNVAKKSFIGITYAANMTLGLVSTLMAAFSKREVIDTVLDLGGAVLDKASGIESDKSGTGTDRVEYLRVFISLYPISGTVSSIKSLFHPNPTVFFEHMGTKFSVVKAEYQVFVAHLRSQGKLNPTVISISNEDFLKLLFRVLRVTETSGILGRLTGTFKDSLFDQLGSKRAVIVADLKSVYLSHFPDIKKPVPADLPDGIIGASGINNVDFYNVFK
jgi:hypothetical protein